MSGMDTEADIWATTLSHIVYHGSIHDLTGALSGLKSCGGLGNVKLVNAELHLPTPFMPTRKLCFLRCEREITQNVWAIVDVSCDYFQSRPLEQEAKCLRRPSGVIIRAHDQYSEVIWIENVEVQECQLQENMYSTIINSNLAFCAKRWISTLLQKIGRKCSRFLNLKMLIGMKASDNLLNLADCLEKVYFECINYIPDQSNWELVSDEKVRILKDKRVDCADNLNPNSYIAVSSFHVQARPLVLFNFLAKKNMEFQWLSLPTLEEPEELINFATEDDSNRITLHHKINEYFLQEVSKNEFCSFIISSPMTETVVNESLTFRQLSNSSLKPSGFTIMPDGSGGLQSGASLLTICVQEELYSLETDLVIEVMNSRINDILSRINEAGNEA